MDFDEFAEFLEFNCNCGVCLYTTHCEECSCKDGVKQWLESEVEIDDIIPNAATVYDMQAEDIERRLETE